MPPWWLSASATCSTRCADVRSSTASCDPGAGLPSSNSDRPACPDCAPCICGIFRRVLPLVGRLVSRHRDAYTYLPASVVEFPSGEAFGVLLRQAGFSDVRFEVLTFGIVYLYLATRGPDGGDDPVSARGPAAESGLPPIGEPRASE